MTSPRETALQTYLGVSPCAPEAQVLRLLIEFGVQSVGGDEGSLLVYDRERSDLVFAMTTADRAGEKTLLGKRLPLGTGLTGLAAVTRSVQIGAPTYGFERSGDAPAPKEPEAVLAAPMLVGEELVGVITAVSFKPGKRFLSANADFYGRMAAIAGVVVQQRRRIDDLERLAKGPGGEAAGAPHDPLAAALVSSVTRLCSRPSTDRAEVVRLLTAVEGLLGRGSGS